MSSEIYFFLLRNEIRKNVHNLGHRKLVQMLIENGSSLDLKSQSGEPVLHRIFNDGNGFNF